MSLLNSDQEATTKTKSAGAPASRPKASGVVVGLAVAALTAGNVYLLSKVHHLEAETDSLHGLIDKRVSGFEEISSAQAGEARREFEALRQQIEETREEATARAQREAQRQAERVSKVVTTSQQRQQEALLGGIHDARSVANDANNEVKLVRNDLMNVRSEVEDTNMYLIETASRLDQTNEGLGEVAGRIDEHASEITQLRRWTEKERIRFELSKSKDLYRVGDVQVRLRDTDAKKSKYSIEILADDKRVMKKDVSIAEPVEFYVGDSVQPYELVITSVKKGVVAGYLSRPKAVRMAMR